MKSLARANISGGPSGSDCGDDAWKIPSPRGKYCPSQATKNLVVKHTFLQLEGSRDHSPSPDNECSRLRVRASSDSALYNCCDDPGEASGALPEANGIIELQPGEELRLTGLSDDEGDEDAQAAEVAETESTATSPGDEEARSSGCETPARQTSAAAGSEIEVPLEPSLECPSGDTLDVVDSRPRQVRLQPTEQRQSMASSGNHGEVAPEGSFENLASENARLTMENMLLRQQCLEVARAAQTAAIVAKNGTIGGMEPNASALLNLHSEFQPAPVRQGQQASRGHAQGSSQGKGKGKSKGNEHRPTERRQISLAESCAHDGPSMETQSSQARSHTDLEQAEPRRVAQCGQSKHLHVEPQVGFMPLDEQDLTPGMPKPGMCAPFLWMPMKGGMNTKVPMAPVIVERQQPPNASAPPRESQQSMPIAPPSASSKRQQYADRAARAEQMFAKHAAAAASKLMGSIPVGNARMSMPPRDGFAGNGSTLQAEHASDTSCLQLTESRTTVMLRNLPNNYSRAMLQDLVDSEGFAKQYDFIYLPIDFKSNACLGYAFVNLVDSDTALRFSSTFDGFSDWILPSRKICSVGWSGPHQGLEAHIERYRNSPVMHEAVPDIYKPAIFKDGIQVRFPAANKKLRAPRIRQFGGGHVTDFRGFTSATASARAGAGMEAGSADRASFSGVLQ